MKTVGKVEALWRYPVKSMAGEQLTQAFLTATGLRGDRLYAFSYSAAPVTFPYFTARQQPDMLLYQASCCTDEKVFIDTPGGARLPVDDRSVIRLISHGIRESESVTLLSSGRPMTDCHPVSLLSLQTTRQLGVEMGLSLNKMRFRANIYLDLNSGRGFEEDGFVGRKLLIGSTAVVEVIERDERCKIITLDPDTGVSNPDIMRHTAQQHERRVGIYANVSVEGMVEKGDEVSLLPND